MRRFSLIVIVPFVVVFSNLNITLAQPSQNQSLHQAIVSGDIEQVKTLLSKGADINERNRLGGSPLHTALINKKQEIAELLISKNPDLNIQDNHGRTPLFLAIETDQKKIAELLLTKNVDVNVVARMGQNALTLARSKGDTELVALLEKHGAQEPVLDTERDLYSNSRGGGASQGGADAVNRIQPRAAARPTSEPSVLSDPNEIKARIKTFAGLEKAIKDVNDKSDAEERQWCQTRFDNRSLLSRVVQSQFEAEMELVRKTAEAEKAKKTIASIDNLVSMKKDRSRKVGRELLQLRREQEQSQSTRGRGRGGRASVRGGRGRSSQRGQYGDDMANSLYDSGGAVGRTSRTERPARPEEQVDLQTEAEIRLWTQADPMKKTDLAKSVNDQILAEMESIRVVAVEEKAKKTTATIDGLMLARQQRQNLFLVKIEEAERKEQERQAQLESRGRGRSNSRYQNNTTQQNTQQRSRSRRR